MLHLSTDVLIVGAGGAGMYAAVAAARSGALVILLDKSLVGRGGATVMAQMTVAAALGQQEPDHWTIHLEDTLRAGRGLCNEELSALVCEAGPKRIVEMESWGTRWAREDSHIKQEMAPGHSRRRCCYVDFLNTGPAVAATLRRKVGEIPEIRRISNLAVIEILVHDGGAVGAVALDIAKSAPVRLQAKVVILAAGGLTKLYERNSASANMAGEAYALALRAGAELVDMEFVQFFPIGHLAPRLVGMDPIMWDPFRYKLGGKLLNSEGEEVTGRYGVSEEGRYVTTRDVATYAIVKEVEAGRGSPHGGVFLSFEHCPEAALRRAFGPVIDRLARNNIDLTKMPIEVAPIAHYHMGGVIADERMQTWVPGLLVAGEAAGGANGANRLSGNAITEALVFGRRAGRSAAERVKRVGAHGFTRAAARNALDLIAAEPTARDDINTAAMIAQLQTTMADDVGPFRTEAKLTRALAAIAEMTAALGERPAGGGGAFDLRRMEWFDLRNMLTVAHTVAAAALARRESRGAHQREDFPGMLPQWRVNQVVRLGTGGIALTPVPAVAQAAAQ